MLAANPVANALGSSYSVLFTSVTSQCLDIAVRFVAFYVAFRGVCFIKTRFSNFDI